MHKTKTHITVLLGVLLSLTFSATTAFAATTTGSGTAGFLNSVNATTNGTNLLAPESTRLYGAAPQIESSLTVFNVTQNKDASQGGNKPGDELKITGVLRNLGPGDLVAYVPKIVAENLLKISNIIDPGDGGVVRGGSLVFDPLNQSADCNCSDDVAITLQLKENLCADFSSIAASGISVAFENKSQLIPVVCETASVSVEIKGEPVKTTTTTKTKPPVTKSGPEHALALFALLSAGGVWYWRKKAHIPS